MRSKSKTKKKPHLLPLPHILLGSSFLSLLQHRGYRERGLGSVHDTCASALPSLSGCSLLQSQVPPRDAAFCKLLQCIPFPKSAGLQELLQCESFSMPFSPSGSDSLSGSDHSCLVPSQVPGPDRKPSPAWIPLHGLQLPSVCVVYLPHLPILHACCSLGLFADIILTLGWSAYPEKEQSSIIFGSIFNFCWRNQSNKLCVMTKIFITV